MNSEENKKRAKEYATWYRSQPHIREAQRRRDRERYWKNHEKEKTRIRERARTPEARAAQEKCRLRRLAADPEGVRKKLKETGRKYHFMLKEEAMKHYGGVKCARCAETELMCLSIDHLENGGNKHRMEIWGRTPGAMYHWLKVHNYPKDPPLQVLCMNCQWIKKYDIYTPAPTAGAEAKRQFRKRLKVLTLEAYGGCFCAYCGFKDIRALSLDHLRDDGKAHAKIHGRQGCSMYDWLRLRGFPNDTPLRVLCMNCQFRKRNGLIEYDFPSETYRLKEYEFECTDEKPVREISLSSLPRKPPPIQRVCLVRKESSPVQKKAVIQRPWPKKIKKEWKVIPVPQEVFDELNQQAYVSGWTIGAVTNNRIKNGIFDRTQWAQYNFQSEPQSLVKVKLFSPKGTMLMPGEKRKPGRPKSDVHKKWRSISVPEDLWNELATQARSAGWTIGKVATNRIYNGVFDPSSEPQRCHGASDGECIWKRCPQLRDGEPAKSGRHCPLDTREDEEMYEM